MRDIGANIRRTRTRRHLTQDDLAQTVHTTRQTISNYETGRSRPDVETLQRLADALGVELTPMPAGRHCAGCASRGPSRSYWPGCGHTCTRSASGSTSAETWRRWRPCS